jgi:hypothetical protein
MNEDRFDLYCKGVVVLADELLPTWVEIRIDEFWQVIASIEPFADTHTGWDAVGAWLELPTDNLELPSGLDRIAFGIIRTPKAKPKAMSDYELICEDGLYDDLVLVDKMVSRADKAFPDGWEEIRMDKGGRCFAYTSPPERRGAVWWGKGDNVEGKNVGMGRTDWNWEIFGIIRTPEAKHKRGKKDGQIKLLARYAAELSSELSATRAMLAESQRELAELEAGLDTLAGWNGAERVDFIGLGFLQEMPSIAEKLGNTQQIQQSWYQDGRDDGAAAMYKAAENTEAAIIYAVNNGTMDIDGAIGAARVVGALGNELARGRLTGEGE